jgi:prephenate dehydrogenase
VVTDVGSVKGSVVAAVDDPRFVGGHPMAGSEQEGLSGARADMFTGAVWVLTPGPGTSDEAFATVRSVVASFDSDVVTMSPDRHDQVVAVVSHVPHLTAVTLMGLADARSEEHRALLRLAAGGFRDMTRIAAGHPGIWPDICAENRAAIAPVLRELVASLSAVAGEVEAGDRHALLHRLELARAARLNLPTGVPRDIPLAELRVTVLDQPGELARITTLATEVDVNIYDLEIAHSAEGARGVVIMVVPQHRGERLVGALMAQGYRPALRAIEA